MELVNGQYLLTEDDVLNNSEFTSAELTEVFGEKLEYNLQNISRKTYRVMYNAYRGIHRERQVAWLDWYIQQEETRQNAMRDASIEYLRGAMYSGMDMKSYLGNEQSYSNGVIDILKENGLWILATVQYVDEDIADA